MSGATVSGQYQYGDSWGRPFWLPPYGAGNGRDAEVWMPVADVNLRVVGPVLTALDRAGLAGWAAPLRLLTPKRARARPEYWRLWVDAAHFGSAEEVVRATVSNLDHA